MSALSWFQQLSPEMQAALVQGGFGLAGGAISGMGEEGRMKAQQEGNMDIARINNLTSLYGADNNRNAAAVNAMKSPLSFARERAGMAFMGDMLGNGGGSASQQVFAPPNIAPYQGRVGGGGGLGSIGSTARQFLTPEAMANAEVPFWQGMAALNPDINPNLGASGYGNAAGTAAAGNPSGQSPTAMIDAVRQKQGQKQDAERNAIYGALMPGGAQGGLGAGAQGQQIPPGYHMHNGKLSKDGSGFWHKFAKIGGILGGGIATAMTGGAASPLLAAAIGAGSGAAAGWGNGGGWKGTLMGGALGGLTGAMGAGASGGAPMSFTNAVKSLATNPSFLMNAGGQYIGGPAGTALQMGSMLAPHGFTANQRAIANIKAAAQKPIDGPLQGTGLDETMGDAGGAGLYPGPAKVTGAAQWQPMIQQILKQALGGGQQGPVPTYGGVPAGQYPGTPPIVASPQERQQADAQMQQMIQRLMALINGGGQQQPYFPAQNPVGGINYGGGGGAVPFTPPFSLYPQVQR